MATEGLEDLSGHFLPLHKPCLKDGRTLCVCFRGREERSWTDYILGTDRHLLQNLASGKHITTRTITWSWVASADPHLSHTHAILGSKNVFPSSHRRPRTGLTAFLLSSRGPFPIHLGGNASIRRGYHRKPGVSSTPGLRHARMGTIKTPGRSAAQSRWASQSIGA